MRNSPLNSFEDSLYKVPFYNIQDNQAVCMGSTFPRGTIFKQSIHEMVDNIYAAFWASQFNTDYSYNMRAYRYRQLFNNYFIWEYQSRYNPQTIFKAKYMPYEQLGNFIEGKESWAGFDRHSFQGLTGFFK